MIYKTLHRNLNIEQRGSHNKSGGNSRASDGYAVPAPSVTPVVLLSNENEHNLIWKSRWTPVMRK
jgi:hypothetical protein